MSRLVPTLNTAKCPRCKGRGLVPGDEGEIMSCPDCDGTGEAEADDKLDGLEGMDGWL